MWSWQPLLSLDVVPDAVSPSRPSRNPGIVWLDSGFGHPLVTPERHRRLCASIDSHRHSNNLQKPSETMYIAMENFSRPTRVIAAAWGALPGVPHDAHGESWNPVRIDIFAPPQPKIDCMVATLAIYKSSYIQMAKENTADSVVLAQCHDIFFGGFSIESCNHIFFAMFILVENPPDALKSKDPR